MADHEEKVQQPKSEPNGRNRVKPDGEQDQARRQEQQDAAEKPDEVGAVGIAAALIVADPAAERGAIVIEGCEGAEIERTVRIAEAVTYVRDLVDTPAADLGPAELEADARALGTWLGLTDGNGIGGPAEAVAGAGRVMASKKAWAITS